MAKTAVNAVSSRSHTIFTIIVKRQSGSATTTARLTCVDLAGSERASKTKPTGVQLTEAKSINQSLSALGNTIAALSNRRHSERANNDAYAAGAGFEEDAEYVLSKKDEICMIPNRYTGVSLISLL